MLESHVIVRKRQLSAEKCVHGMMARLLRMPCLMWPFALLFCPGLSLAAFGAEEKTASSNGPAPATADAAKKEASPVTPPGPLQTEQVRFQFAVYYLPTAAKDPASVLKQLLVAEKEGLSVADKLPEKVTCQLVRGVLINDVQRQYAPPDLESLQYFGRGLTKEQTSALQKSRQAFVMEFAHPSGKAWSGLRKACEVAEAVARETGGLLWDEETRQVFSPDEWHRLRLGTWTEPVPDVSCHIAIHAYRKDQFGRAITLGMAKVGLPDVVVNEFSRSDSGQIATLINLLCQSMAEGGTVGKDGGFSLNIRALKNKVVRERALASLKKNAEAKATLQIMPGKVEEGDPSNRLFEITFDQYKGTGLQARQDNMLSGFFGAEESVMRVRHDDKLLAASRAAKARLPELAKTFAAGLRPGEIIMVKAPFITSSGGNEWMWVEVTAWQGEKIKGVLKNDPECVPALHLGDIVDVRESEVFDYIFIHVNGQREGNETSKIILEMQKEGDEP